MISGQLARSPPFQDAIDLKKVRTMRIMEFSVSKSWTVSCASIGLLKGKIMESGTNSCHVKERKRKLMEEVLGSTLQRSRSLYNTALLLGLEKLT